MTRKDPKLQWLLGFCLLKILIHFYTDGLYGLHRDEFLYIDEGRHLAWGFMEVPPFTPFVAWFADWFGNHPIVFRFIPSVAGALIIFFVGKMIISVGGGKWAIIFASNALLVSPSLLRSATLLQPVIFNQLFWLMSAYWVLRILQTEEHRYWYYLGATVGIAFLNKYSILFYVVALIIGLLLTPQRKILFQKHFPVAILIAMIIASPNIFWQYAHNWPVITHMRELSERQLVHVNWSGFLADQLLFHFLSGTLWITGIVALFRYISNYRYRFVVLAYFATILIIGSLSGKSYYTIGAYYALFPFGAILLERVLSKSWQKGLFIAGLVIFTAPILPLGTSILPIDQLKAYCKYLDEEVGFDAVLYWEDGKKYALPQDFADMHGWEELARKVGQHYNALPDTIRDNTIIYGGSYGHAGSLNFYREKYDLPETYSRNGSYMLWGNEDARFDHIIVIEEEHSDRWRDFGTITLVDSISDPYARDKGYTYFQTDTLRDPSVRWKAVYVDARKRFHRD
ncbi:MAG: glycosyltransferase family 39 protein [Bacteroidia bacterium]|nr:glycosyltransferase family 39 protein [Bacteroidia bacterium]